MREVYPSVYRRPLRAETGFHEVITRNRYFLLHNLYSVTVLGILYNDAMSTSMMTTNVGMRVNEEGFPHSVHAIKLCRLNNTFH